MAFTERITLAGADLFPLRARGGVSPKMALGAMPTRPALLLRLRDNDGCEGWGEVWANFPPRANLHKSHLISDVVAPKLSGMAFSEPREIPARLRAQLEVYFLHVGQSRVLEHILAGLDAALWDLALRKAGRSFAEHLGLAAPSAQTYASSINPPDLARLLPLHARMGQRFFKLKIGHLGEGEQALIAKAAALKPEGTRLMVDSNQSWSLPEAIAALKALEAFDPLFAEESLRADAPPSDWETLAKATAIPLAGGENIYGVEAFLSMAAAGLKVLQPDVAKWGGVTGALDLAAALPSGVTLWPHFMGTALGQVAALNVTAAIGDEAVCEMDVNENRLRTELCGDVLAVRDGRVALPKTPGLAPPPRKDRLEGFIEPVD